jgi:Carbohydrate binding module (family 6)/Ricin-type beta-trefoil lectin domain
VPVTGGWDTYTDVTTTLTSVPAATTALYLVFTGPAGYLFNVDDFRLTTSAAAPVEAETFTSQSGVQVSTHQSASGGHTVGYIENGDWTAYSSVSTAGARTFSARVSSAGSGGTIEVHAGSATGPLLGSASVPVTGHWESFTVVSGLLSAAGSGPLVLVYRGGAGFLFDVDTFVLTTTPGGSGPVVGIENKCLGVAGGDTTNGTPIVIWGCNGNADQKWTFGPDGTVRSMGKCLDVSGYGTTNGSLTHLWDCASPTPTPNQIWVPQLDGTIRNPVSGRCLDVVGVASTDGARLHLWDCYNGPNQEWQVP